MEAQENIHSSWLDRSMSSVIAKMTVENILAFIIILLTLVSRFYELDLRVMSHDEVNHVVPAYELFRGRGYRYDPVTHGPLQFHLLGLSYFLLGDSDFSARVPAVLFSIATVVVVLFGFRRYIGRTGALIAGLLFVISPFMLFYGRYTRNEAFGGLWTVVTLFAALRYLDRGDRFSLILMTAVTALHFTDKATAYIYTAQMLLFLALYFLLRVVRARWESARHKDGFIILTGLALLLFLAALGIAIVNSETVPEGLPAQTANPTGREITTAVVLEYVGVAGSILAALGAIFLLVVNVGWKAIRADRSFDLLVLLGVLVLPQLSAFPVRMFGWNPLDYSTTGIVRTGFFIILLSMISAAIGLWWRPRLYIGLMVLFFSIFTVFFTTFFTNGLGFFMGLVGSLGYWLSQQGVQRGSQPLYYYILIQIPFYEFLPFLGMLAALVAGFVKNRFSSIPGIEPAHQPQNLSVKTPDPMSEGQDVDEVMEVMPQPGEGVEEMDIREIEEAPPSSTQPESVPVLALLLWWSLTSLAAYSLAGEKMPWLTVHITGAMLLSTGWLAGYFIDTTPWRRLLDRNGLVTVLMLPVMLSSFLAITGSLLGDKPPFQGSTVDQLQSTSTFFLGLVSLVISSGVVYYHLKDWKGSQTMRLIGLTVFALLGMLTARAAYMAAFINYDMATEYLVYAHAARGPKDVLEQVEEISRRTTRGKDVVIAYDNDSLYPFWWYLRDYPNHKWFTDKPTRELKDAALIIAGESNYAKLEPIVRDAFVYYEYMRLWWPNQDYFTLTPEKVTSALSDPKMRAAIFKIWLNRDYTDYAKLTGSSQIKPENWQPGNRMRFYIRKDILTQIWNYGALPTTGQAVETDPYASKMTRIAADFSFGSNGNAAGQFNTPRGVAFARDGSFYVADSRNFRIQHFSATGQWLHTWGVQSDSTRQKAVDGGFNEPWGIVVGLDGSVFVADTWNHRIQKFTADGKFLLTWGAFGQAERPDAFWGPRGLAVDGNGNVFVTDTGNKRVVVFTPEGKFVTQFGSVGLEIGQFDEPVGIAISKEGLIYIADTWNQRIQVFKQDSSGLTYLPVQSWEVKGWFGQSLDNKPFIAVDQNGYVYISDPEGYRVLQFSPDGTFVRGWGDTGTGNEVFGLPSGIAVSPDGSVWVTDAAMHRLMRFNLQKP